MSDKEESLAEVYYRNGCNYEHGDGVAKDFEEASTYYRLAEEQGHSSARKSIEYLEGYLKYMETHKSEKLLGIIERAEGGDAIAQTDLGLRYREGAGVPASHKMAAYWYEKAAVQKDMAGQYFLGECYEMGYGVEKDIAKALELYELAARQGVGIAYYQIGNIYLEGNGVEKDRNKAYNMFWRAYDAGYREAKLKIVVMEWEEWNG